VRPLASDDLLRGHFALLSTLTTSPAVAPSLYTSIFEYLKSIQGIYYVIVFVHKPTDELVAAATLFVERKLIHAGGIAGHIEDVVVAPQCRGTGIGLRLVSGLKELGDLVGCYKTILDCREDRVGKYLARCFRVRADEKDSTRNADLSEEESKWLITPPTSINHLLLPLPSPPSILQAHSAHRVQILLSQN
jgi:GNAT superfamily N-acetyltransferase